MASFGEKMTVTEIKRPQELSRLRRLALAAQGLLQNQAYGRGLAGAREAINHLGYDRYLWLSEPIIMLFTPEYLGLSHTC